MKVLFVCLGNICRSPTAEAVLRRMAPGVEVDSAGTGHWHVGSPPHPPMQAVAAAAGYDMADLRARQVARTDFAAFDLIAAMDRANLRDLRALCPAGAPAALHLLADYHPDLRGQDVPDPYYTGDCAATLRMVETACTALAARLADGQRDPA